jgi:hypothetical protein
LARVAKEQGLAQERLRRWVSFLALCGVLERAVSEGILDNYYLKGGAAMELRFPRVAVAAYNALSAGKENAAPLCTNRNGELLYEMRYWFLRALEASGVKDFTFYDVRHTAASRWVMSGVPLAAVAKYLGHSGAAMVMRYAHLQPEVNAKAINAAMSFYPQAAIQTDTKTKSDTKSDTNGSRTRRRSMNINESR